MRPARGRKDGRRDNFPMSFGSVKSIKEDVDCRDVNRPEKAPIID
jgi:hypothetical protein